MSAFCTLCLVRYLFVRLNYCAAFCVYLVLVFVAAVYKLDLVHGRTVVAVKLGDKPRDRGSGQTCVRQRNAFCLFVADVACAFLRHAAALLLCAVAVAAGLCWIFHLESRERRTIVIEVGMQNAAQAIAIASSPFVFNDGRIAIPAIIYALMMNVILLIYVGIVNRAKSIK